MRHSATAPITPRTARPVISSATATSGGSQAGS